MGIVFVVLRAVGAAAAAVGQVHLRQDAEHGVAEGKAVGDAMFGILPEVHLPDRGSGSTDGAEYYKYNPHKEG